LLGAIVKRKNTKILGKILQITNRASNVIQ